LDLSGIKEAKIVLPGTKMELPEDEWIIGEETGRRRRDYGKYGR
jgi:hypothetical protein